MNFICNKKTGCAVQNELPEEIERFMREWDDEISERTKERKQKGCWNPEKAKCDCPACGGFND